MKHNRWEIVGCGDLLFYDVCNKLEELSIEIVNEWFNPMRNSYTLLCISGTRKQRKELVEFLQYIGWQLTRKRE